MALEFDVVCLGGGVAGEAIAGELQGGGLSLAVVERELVGGECPYWGCVPSKTLLRSGETLEEAARARTLAASRVEWDVDFPKVSKRVLWMARDLDDTRPAAALEATGAKLVRGDGKLVDLRTVVVGGEQLVARRAVVIANGGTAAIPPIEGLDKVEYWTNRQAAVPRELPERLVVLGGGAVGVELAQAFARLGSRVTIVEAGPRFLALEEPEAGDALKPHLEADGIEILIGDPCVAVEKQAADAVLHLKSGSVVSGDRLLVATGRRPNFEAWRAAGPTHNGRGCDARRRRPGRRAGRRDAGHASRGRDPGRAGGGGEAGPAGPQAGRRDPPVSGVQPRARRRLRAALLQGDLAPPAGLAGHPP